MKKNLISAICLVTLFLSVASVNAQSTASANLKIVISPLLSIKVNSGASDAVLTFDDEDDYANGVETTVSGHLTISSLLPYTVKLKSNTTTLNGASENINVAAVSVEIPGGTTNNTALAGTIYGATFSPISALSDSDQPLIGGNYAMGNLVDVKYAVPSANVASEILGKPAGDYTAVLTYTISNP